MRLPCLVITIFSLGVMVSGGGVLCAEDYPNKPIRWILPFPPGGATDIIGRIVGQKMTESSGQPVIIDSRGGGATIVGTELAARAAPDGYTMLMGTLGFAITPSLRENQSQASVRDFSAVSLIGNGSLALVIHPAVAVRSVKELVALAKAKPNQLNYGTTGGGTSGNLCALLFQSMTGARMTEITYKGAGPNLTALVGGEVNLAFNSILPILPYVRTGRLRALGVTGSRRSQSLPDVPTISEAGVNGYELNNWYSILVPNRTPQSVVSKLNTLVVRAVQSADVQDRLTAQGLEPAYSSPVELSRYIAAEVAKWSRLIRESRESGALHN